MNLNKRQYFDQQLELVLSDLPSEVHKLLDDVPLFVEDYPSREVMAKTKVRHRSQLCGLYTGIPLTERSIDHSGILPDVIHIYRVGVLSLAADETGHVSPDVLREEIRKTILHELGHHHGLSERDLWELGYG
jgi:predicted Zn-dependent protease with MMP-like domain